MTQRVAAEMFGEFFSLHLNALKQKDILDTANRARRSLDRFLQSASHNADVSGLLRQSLTEFAQIMPSDGVGLWLDGHWNWHGVAPPTEAMPAIADFVSSVSGGRIWSTDTLSLHLPQAESYAPSLRVAGDSTLQRPRDYLFFFRKELVQTLDGPAIRTSLMRPVRWETA